MHRCVTLSISDTGIPEAAIGKHLGLRVVQLRHRLLVVLLHQGIQVLVGLLILLRQHF